MSLEEKKERERELSDAKNNVTEKENKIIELQQKLSEKENKIAELQILVTEINRDKQRMTDELDTLKRSKNELEQTNRELTQSKDKLETEKLELKGKIEEAKQEKDALEQLLRESNAFLLRSIQIIDEKNPTLSEEIRNTFFKFGVKAENIPLKTQYDSISVQSNSLTDIRNDDLTDYKYTESENQSLENVFTLYKNILERVKYLQEQYITFIDTIYTQVEQDTLLKKYIRNIPYLMTPYQDESNTYKNKEFSKFTNDDKNETLIIYTFLTTVLFQLTKTFIRLPYILRLISLPNLTQLGPYNMVGSQILKLLYIESKELFTNQELNNKLNTVNPNIFKKYSKQIAQNQNKLRIDVLSYYLMQFMFIIKDKESKVTEFNGVLNIVSILSKNILDNLNKIMTVGKDDTNKKLSDLEQIKINVSTQLESEHKQSNEVITFVKIRVDGESPVDINKRFTCNVLTKDAIEKQIMHLTYSDFDYRKNRTDDPIYGNRFFEANGFKFYNNINDKYNPPTCNLDKIVYNHEFYFGPFTKIYTADQTAKDIVEDDIFIKNIEKKLRNYEPVCIIGYGASGSGKTSTLVYYSNMIDGNFIEQDGILSELSNKLTDTFNKCTIQVYEFEGNIKETSNESANKNSLLRKFPSAFKTAKKNEKKFIKCYISNNETDPNKMNPNDPALSAYEYEKSSSGKSWVKKNLEIYDRTEIKKEVYEDNESEKRISDEDKYYDEEEKKYYKISNESNKPISMAKDISTFMDKKRSIAATTNNPVSSRSHVIIFVNYIDKDNNKTTLILCDFAGVENKFNCKSDIIKSQFASILDPIKLTPFYESKMNEIKSKFYKEYVDQNEVSINDILTGKKEEKEENILKQNIDFILKDIVDYPLNKKDSEEMEKKYQELYDPNQMVSINDFLIRLKKIEKIRNVFDIKKINNIDNDWIIDKIKCVKISELHNNTYKDTIPIGKITIKNSSTYTKIYNMNTIELFIKDNITNFFDSGILITTKKHMNYELKNTVEPNIVDKYKVILVMYYYSSSGYAEELFVKYSDPEDRRIKLKMWKYYFEMCISGKVETSTTNITYPATYSNIQSNFSSDICVNRVKEGVFINDSLLQLRNFIGSLVKLKSNGYAPFVTQCLPLQCNPFYKDCFGLNEYDSEMTIPIPSSSKLADQIMKVNTPEKPITFCIMCVVNLSKKANNPPPSPYIDITQLLMEKERLNNIDKQLFLNEDNIGGGAYLSNSPKVNENILDNIINNPLFGRPIDESIINDIKEKIDLIKTANKENDYTSVILILDKVIEILNNINAITTIGTLQFTDTMAKFGSNSVTCNVNSKIITKKQTEDNYIKQTKELMDTITKPGANLIFNGLTLIKSKTNITTEELLKDYGTLTNIYDPEKDKNSWLYKEIVAEIPDKIKKLQENIKKLQDNIKKLNEQLEKEQAEANGAASKNRNKNKNPPINLEKINKLKEELSAKESKLAAEQSELSKLNDKKTSLGF